MRGRRAHAGLLLVAVVVVVVTLPPDHLTGACSGDGDEPDGGNRTGRTVEADACRGSGAVEEGGGRCEGRGGT